MKKQRTKIAITFTLLFLFPVLGIAQTFWYVDGTNTSGPWDGSQANPFHYIQDGIDAASHHDTVLVLPYTYVENIDFLGKAITVMSDQGAAVTTIDGNQEGSVVTFQSGEDENSVLDGFTITNGNAECGSGMYNSSSSPTVNNCTFSENGVCEYDGGGMYNDNSSPTITYCTFTGNQAHYHCGGGGGIYNYNSNPTINSCTFTGNSAAYAGGMCDGYNSNSIVINCTFIENSATYHAGGMANTDGTTVTNCTFFGNSAFNGGGMCNGSGTTVTDCTFTENSANFGGGMYSESGNYTTVTNCTFTGNSANYGGGMYNASNYPTISNCLFIGNSANYGGGVLNEYDGGQMFFNCIFNENMAHINGGGMCNHSSNPYLINCTISQNSSFDSGGGIYCYNSSPNIRNTILWNNNALYDPEIYVNNSSPNVTYCDVCGGWPGVGNIDEEPLFVSGPEGDYYLSQINAGQAVNSPCVDAGSDQASILGMDTCWTRTDEFPDDGVVNMGFHYGPFSIPSPTTINIPEDYPSIQMAIVTAEEGSLILVAPGTYMENINYLGKSITVRSDVDGIGVTHDISPETTILNGNHAGPVAIFESFEGSESVLEGFTITNGYAQDWYGGGIWCFSSNPTIMNNIIIGNSADYYGGGMCNWTSSPTLIQCTFAGNLAERGGGLDNWCDSNPTIINCTFCQNTANGNGGGMWNGNSSPTVTNCILWDNTPDEISGTSTVTYSDVKGGWPGTGNIDANPLFLDPLNNDYHLTYASPCIDAGDNNAPSLPDRDFEGDPRIFPGNGKGYLVGYPPQPAIVDMGADEYCLLKRHQVIPK